LRGRPRFSGVAGEPLSNQSKKAFDMGQLPASLPDPLVGRVFLKNRPVGFPKVTETLFFAIRRWNFRPQPSASLRRPVPDYEGDDLPGSTAERDPEPAFVRPLADVSPAFVKFEDIALLGRLNLLG
jgi:hypothetical protein